jgi:predicted fused transcriptional regulator/phosphomethylpyrimidine kinase
MAEKAFFAIAIPKVGQNVKYHFVEKNDFIKIIFQAINGRSLCFLKI